MPCRTWLGILALVVWGCGGESNGESSANGEGGAGGSGSSGAGGASLAPTHGWSTAFDASTLFTDQAPAVAADASGNIYVTGSLHGTTGDFGGGPLTDNMEMWDDVFLASFAPDGAHRWSRRFGGQWGDCGESIAVDAAGNVYITGQLGDEGADFGGGPLAMRGAFAASFTSDGQHRWSQAFGEPTSDTEGFGIAVGTQGDVYITGMFWGTADFGGGPLTSLGPTFDKGDVFLASFTTDGAYRWALAFGDDERSIARAVAASGDRVVIAGSFRGSPDFGGGALVATDPGTSTFAQDLFVASFTAAGAYRFSAAYGSVQGADDDEVLAVAVDAAGTAYVAGAVGRVGGSGIDFGGGPLSLAGGGDPFLVAFSPMGQHLWSHAFGGQGVESAFDLDIDEHGHILCAAEFTRETFVGSFASDGSLRWQYAASTGTPFASGVAAAPGGRIYMTGQFNDTVDFGGAPLSSPPDDDRIFLLQLLEPNGGSL